MEFRCVTRFRVSDQVVDLFIHPNVVFAKFAHELIFTDLPEHISCNDRIHFRLVHVHGRIVNALTILLFSTSVISHIQSWHWSDWSLRIFINHARLLQNTREVTSDGIFSKIVSKLSGGADFFLN